MLFTFITDSIKINFITVKSTDKSTTVTYDAASQHRAIEAIEDYMTAFLNRNACDVFGGVNLNIYKNIPECYGIEEKTVCKFPKTETEQVNALPTVITLPVVYTQTVTKPKQTFLETKVAYYEPTGDGYTQKKLALLERSSDLPSSKKLANMLMKVTTATKNVFVSKVVPLSEEVTTELEKGKEEENLHDLYGEGYFGY